MNLFTGKIIYRLAIYLLLVSAGTKACLSHSAFHPSSLSQENQELKTETSPKLREHRIRFQNAIMKKTVRRRIIQKWEDPSYKQIQMKLYIDQQNKATLNKYAQFQIQLLQQNIQILIGFQKSLRVRCWIQNLKNLIPIFNQGQFLSLLFLFVIGVSSQYYIQELTVSRDIIWDVTDYIMINSTFYYYLVSKQLNKAAGYHYREHMHKEKPYFQQIDDQNPQTLWMIKSANLENVYVITHCSSGHVMEIVKQQKIELHHRKDKTSQQFKLKIVSEADHQFWIEEYAIPTNLLHYADGLTCVAMDPSDDKSKWVLKRAVNNFNILNSAILECEYSGHVLQVSDNAEKDGDVLNQASWTGLFHQRWLIQKAKDFYILKNVKSDQVATLKGKKVREGASVVQTPQSVTYSNQLWSIDERGYKVYSIRTALDPELFLGTKDRAIQQNAQIVLVKDEYRHLWRIIGQIP